MNKPFGNILFNSTLAFTSAFTITTIIHETGHYLAYLAFGSDPTLYHNYVESIDASLSIRARIITALAGPVASLVQGLVFAFIATRGGRNTAGHLLFLWLGLLGIVNFFGYLMMTPFFISGDTGKAAELLNWSRTSRILIAVAGLGILIWAVVKTGRKFSNFIPAGLDRKTRSKYVYRLMFFPIIFGSTVNTILAFPAVALLSIIYPATSTFVIMSSFGSILNSQGVQVNGSEIEERIMWPLMVLFITSVVINRLLTFGIG